ncbi:MAG: hypothetical protein Tsb0013_14850 [Phycisphaerales bacterium]
MKRELSIIPILHTSADMGQLADGLRAHVGEEAWQRKQRAVDAWWDGIERWAGSQLDDAQRMTLYQDGLPDDPNAEAIVRDLADQGSRNHVVLARLMDAGAALVGTEDPQLLVREYEIARQTTEALSAGREPDPRFAQRSEALLRRRDMYIASRIDDTLGGDRHGVLFIGALHDPARFLPENVTPSYPLGDPARDATITGAIER